MGTEFGKHYGTKAEYSYRLDLFKTALEHIDNHNESNGETHELGINHMSDWSDEEYNNLLGYKPSLRNGGYQSKVEMLDTSNLAADINWVTKGAVTPVKNQGQCGSCWAFSTTGSVEGAEFLATGKLQSFSEQQLVDCDKVDQSCNGGLMDNAFKYIEKSPHMLESEYPYRGTHYFWNKCKFDATKAVGKVTGFTDVVKDATGANLKAALAKGPVSVAIEADQTVFQSYKTGVITSSKCGTQLDHGVLAVGYGTEDGKDYFLVKNSWGPSW